MKFGYFVSKEGGKTVSEWGVWCGGRQRWCRLATK